MGLWLRQGSGKDLIQPVLDNQLKAASPLVLPPQVHLCSHPTLAMLFSNQSLRWTCIESTTCSACSTHRTA